MKKSFDFKELSRKQMGNVGGGVANANASFTGQRAAFRNASATGIRNSAKFIKDPGHDGTFN